MKFKIGSLVEVSAKKKHPSYAWRCAEVVAVDHDEYSVRYYRRPGIVKEGVDKVAAEEVRPCPPVVGNTMAFSVGDVVEVFDDGYWKVCMIEEVMEGGCYRIRVIGSFDEFRVHKSNIRGRQEWNKNQWVLVDKEYGVGDDLIARIRKKAHMRQIGDSLNVKQFAEPSPKSLKRSFAETFSTNEAFSEFNKKGRALSKEVDLDASIGDLCSVIGKVDSCAALKESSTKARSQVHNVSWGNHGTMLLTGTSALHDCVSSISSVASCSIFDSIPDRVLSHASASCSQDLCSDAESSDVLGDECGMSADAQEDTIRTHELDLRSYRYVLEALFASGPLSWEQELLLTNIRMKLYVSNDEHLTELKRLKCFGNALSCH